jgi:hypothetical protein
MLTDLQLGEVEAERLDLPDQVLQLPVRLAYRTRLDQGVLHDPQVGEEVGRAVVAQVGVAPPGGLDAFGGVQDELAVRLARRALGDVGDQLGLGRAGAGQRAAQGGGGWCRALVRRERAADAGAGEAQGAQDVVRLDPDRLAGDLRGDVRVAVAVAADPATDAQERR